VDLYKPEDNDVRLQSNYIDELIAKLKDEKTPNKFQLETVTDTLLLYRQDPTKEKYILALFDLSNQIRLKLEQESQKIKEENKISKLSFLATSLQVSGLMILLIELAFIARHSQLSILAMILFICTQLGYLWIKSYLSKAESSDKEEVKSKKKKLKFKAKLTLKQ
jgi:hypothetical protein